MPTVVLKANGQTMLEEEFPTAEDAEGRVEMLLAEGRNLGNYQYSEISGLWYSETMGITIQIVED